MIKDERNRNGYSEEYDYLGLEDLAKLAMRYVATDSFEGYHDIFRTKGHTVPDGSYSDLSCNIWSLMNKLVRFGINLEKARKMYDDYNVFALDDMVHKMNLDYLGFNTDQRLELRDKRE